MERRDWLFMGKILLCGNGINIEFNKKFNLEGFIDLLLDKNKFIDFSYKLNKEINKKNKMKQVEYNPLSIEK